MNWSENFREGLAREIRENNSLYSILMAIPKYMTTVERSCMLLACSTYNSIMNPHDKMHY